MVLTVTVDTKTFQIDVPQYIIDDGEDFFRKMDQDMGKGWQMSREYVDAPDAVQRCQIVADRILTAMHNNNKDLMLMMAGYIVSRLPKVTHVTIDDSGNMQETQFEYSE